jgi:hypothetical protein
MRPGDLAVKDGRDSSLPSVSLPRVPHPGVPPLRRPRSPTLLLILLVVIIAAMVHWWRG